MRKETINDKEGICLFICYVIGSSLIIGIGGNAKNDAWIAVIIGIIMVIPMLYIYTKIMSLYKEQDLFDILKLTLGNFVGSVITIIYIIYAFYLGALVLRNFGEFINIEAMPETPMFIPMLCLGFVCIIAARLGIEVLGKTTAFFLPLVITILIIVQLLVIPQFHLNYLKPVLGNGLNPVFSGAFSSFSFPFAETVLFLCVFSSLKTEKSSFRIFIGGITISSIIMIAITIRNIGVLGNMLGNYYFPSYQAVSRIKIGEFLQRIEVTVSFVFFIGAFIKSSICLLVAAKGISKLLNLKDYRPIIIQIGLIMIYFAYIVFDSSMEMKYWAVKVYPFFAFPVQVIIPVIIWIIAEIKVRKKSIYREDKLGL